MIGTNAGYGASTNNADLSTDTASTFIGYNAGREADNISNGLFIGTNAGDYAKGATGSIFIGQNLFEQILTESKSVRTNFDRVKICSNGF